MLGLIFKWFPLCEFSLFDTPLLPEGLGVSFVLRSPTPKAPGLISGQEQRFRKWFQFSSVQLISCVQLFVTPWTAACQALLSSTNSGSLLNIMSIELVMPSNYLIPWCPLLLPPSNFPIIRVFPNESVLYIRWLKYWSSSFSISPPSEYSGLISFRMDWLDLLAVQGTLKSLLQHDSSRVPILWRLAFFMVQLSHPYMTTGKTIALTRQIFVSKVLSLLFNMLSRLVIAFLQGTSIFQFHGCMAPQIKTKIRIFHYWMM